ncbi:MAG: 7TM-DISM domain-containing protein [Thermonemataceae bacterium]
MVINKIVNSLLVALVLVGPMVAKSQAQPSVSLSDSKEKVMIGNRFSYLEDASNQYTLNDILEETTQQKFKPFPKTTPSLGYINHPIWIKLTIDNQHASLEDWYLDVDYILLDTLEVYYQKDGSWQKHLMGDHIPIEDWPTPHRSFVAPIKAPSQYPYLYSSKLYRFYFSTNHDF